MMVNRYTHHWASDNVIVHIAGYFTSWRVKYER